MARPSIVCTRRYACARSLVHPFLFGIRKVRLPWKRTSADTVDFTRYGDSEQVPINTNTTLEIVSLQNTCTCFARTQEAVDCKHATTSFAMRLLMSSASGSSSSSLGLLCCTVACGSASRAALRTLLLIIRMLLGFGARRRGPGLTPRLLILRLNSVLCHIGLREGLSILPGGRCDRGDGKGGLRHGSGGGSPKLFT